MSKPTWLVHKFGGTSVANADRYRAVVEILKSTTQPHERQGVVVSAMSKVTDSLIELTRLAQKRDASYESKLLAIVERHLECLKNLLPPAAAESLSQIIKKDATDIHDILRSLWIAKFSSESSVELVSGYGEIWSAQILNQALLAAGLSSTWLDAREVLVVEPHHHTVAVQWPESSSKTNQWLRDHSEPLVVITGFVASTKQGVATTLKRNGSDFSGSIFGQLFGAREIVIWTDVDGVMSADPRLVPDAVVLERMSYSEASELAYFGAKVVHPDTMGPAILNKIPIWIKNTFRPHLPGTCISAEISRERPIKGFATMENISLVNVEGTGMVGVPGVSQRLFGALKEVGVSVVMISQASSEQSICFAVLDTQADKAKAAVEQAFASELYRKEIQSIKVIRESSVIAMVGDGMAQSPGVAGRFFTALGQAGANVLAIAQGSSERNISAVVARPQIHRAVRAAHSAFFLSHQTLSVGVIGTGVVGKTFLEQLSRRFDSLKKERGIDIRLRGVMNSKKMVTHETGLSVNDWAKTLADSPRPADLDSFSRFIHESDYPHSVIVDLTASAETTSRYSRWMDAGLNLITANKRAGSDDLHYYKSLQKIARRKNRHFLYETTVGAGLPVLRTLRDLIETGDTLYEVEGILSGTLSFLFNSYDGTKPFSEVVRQAKEKGFTEPDPRDDLSGADVGRKLVILAREAGFDILRENVTIESLVPPQLQNISLDEFMRRLPELDHDILALHKNAQAHEQVLRYVGHVDRDLKATVQLKALPKTHPFARLSGSDNIILFRTARYHTQPMVIQGPGAGPDVTAAGVFAELLRLADYLGAPR
jgi:aspartokinase/homoserine dehydrogenase 1